MRFASKFRFLLVCYVQFSSRREKVGVYVGKRELASRIRLTSPPDHSQRAKNSRRRKWTGSSARPPGSQRIQIFFWMRVCRGRKFQWRHIHISLQKEKESPNSGLVLATARSGLLRAQAFRGFKLGRNFGLQPLGSVSEARAQKKVRAPLNCKASSVS